MTEKSLVYLDANVLIPSITRGLLIMGAVTSDYRVGWSRFGETEAERHQYEGAAKISDLRRRFQWEALVPDAEPADMVDTDAKDQPHLAAAHAAGARLIITDNIRDFGVQDLERLLMAAVTPDLFLSTRLDRGSYTTVLESLAQGRTRAPNTPEEIHRKEVGRRLPLLAEEFAAAFHASSDEPATGKMTLTFRGFRCVRCEKAMEQADAPLCSMCS